MLLKYLAIILGVLVVISRGYGLLFTESARKLMRGMVERKLLMLVLGLVAALLGAVIGGAARVVIWPAWRDIGALPADVAWQTLVMLALGILMAVSGLLLLALPRFYVRFFEKFLGMKTLTLRLLFLLGVAFGALLIYAGATMP